MKGVFVILDGGADEPSSILKGKTPLEAAITENLNWFAERGRLDHCYTVREKFVPESNEGVLSLLGYDPFTIGRGWLEALGAGIKLKNGDLAFRCNFATVDNLKDKNILDRRAGRNLTTRGARSLAKAVNENVKIPFKFEFYSSIQHRGVLVIRGGFSDNITDIKTENNKLSFSKTLDDEDDSKLSSEIVNKFVRDSFEVLDKHPINLERRRKGSFPANIILCRGASSEKPRLEKLNGKWMALGYMPLEIGIAKIIGMDIYSFKYPRLRSLDVYANLHFGLKKAVKNAIRMIKRNKKKYDYFYVHFKETDIPGHDGKPLEKVKMIEFIDQRFFNFLRRYIRDERLIVTVDHTTSCNKKAHTSDPVPVLSYPVMSKNVFSKGQRFTETYGLKGRKLIGRNVLRMFD